MKSLSHILKTVSVVLLTFVCFSNDLAGQRTITGVIKDAGTLEAVIGANVFVKDNPTVGTITDINGEFVISVDQNATTLVISYIGYQTIEKDIASGTNFEILLYEGQLLDDVIIIGYGTVKREDATGSVQAVNAKDFNRGAITSPQELMAGKVAGVAITTGGGPDDGVQIRVRGLSSLSASSDPLIVIDGVPVNNENIAGNRNILNIINPNDIETMTVLKDASATAIYGSRASAGVILITTKKGALGSKMTVGYVGNVSFSDALNKVDVLNAAEFRNLINTNFVEGHPSRDLLGENDTNWQNEIFRTAIGHDHNINISGSTESVPYRVSLGYTSKDGLLKTDHFNRYTAGINVNPKLLDNTLQVNLGLKAMLNQNRFAERGAIGSAISWDPTQKPFDSESPYSGYTTWTLDNGNPNGLAPANPVALLNQRDDRSDVNRYIANATFDYRLKFLPALRANLNLGYDQSRGNGITRIPGGNIVGFSFQQDFGGGLESMYNSTRTNSLLEFYLNYKKDIKDHSIDAIAGYSWQRFFYEEDSERSFANGSDKMIVPTRIDELFLLSMFSRINYGYKNKYLLTLTMRGDATSRFSPEARWGLFPSAAFAVKLIENKDMYFNNVKLRTGWGVTGQQAVGDAYVYQSIYRLSRDNALYQFGDEFIYTQRPNGYDNNIKWEETETYNIGFDLSIINGKLSSTIDVYQRNTKDLLNFVQVPAGSNLTNFINTNIGRMVNKGVEFSLNYTAISNSKTNWDISFNGAYNTNKVTKLTTTDDPSYIGRLTGGISGGVGSNIQIHSVGFVPASFFVFKQLYDEDGRILEGQFADLNNDGVINEDDKYRFQKPAADVIMGITSNFKYKSFDFSFAGRANLGNYVYNNVATDAGNIARSYHPTNYLLNVHRTAVTNNITEQRNVIFSDHYVTDASFFRLDHITFGYSFEKLLGQFMRVYTTVQNPILITKYEGLDPEIGNGIDNNIYPRSRTFVFGLSVDF